MAEPCLGCDLLSGATDAPGGFVYETDRWVVNHCVGPLGLGTLVVAPRRHVVRVSDLDRQEVEELGQVLHRSASVLDDLLSPTQVYVCLWSHGETGPKHLHWVVQPVSEAVVRRHGGKRSEALQLAMFQAEEYPPDVEVVAFCVAARVAFA